MQWQHALLRLKRPERTATLILLGLLLVGIGIRLYRAQQPILSDFDAAAYFASHDSARVYEKEVSDRALHKKKNGIEAPRKHIAVAPRYININTATATQLHDLPRIGPALATRIIAYRQEHGLFMSVQGLLAVKGIGTKTLNGFRERITVEAQP